MEIADRGTCKCPGSGRHPEEPAGRKFHILLAETLLVVAVARGEPRVHLQGEDLLVVAHAHARRVRLVPEPHYTTLQFLPLPVPGYMGYQYINNMCQVGY